MSDTSLRKHAYSNILRILPPKYENFHMKNPGSFHISAQNLDCGTPVNPSFTVYNRGLSGSQLYRRVFVMF